MNHVPTTSGQLAPPTQSIPFTKMQGLGNDFVVLDHLGRAPLSLSLVGDEKAGSEPLSPKQAQEICDRRFGVGADQILILRKPTDSSQDAFMEIMNADGSTVEMCGNGIRAAGLYLDRYYSLPKKEYKIGTLAGLKEVVVTGDHVRVDMSPPQFRSLPLEPSSIEWDGQIFDFYQVGMGNPHAVFFVDDVDSFPVEKFGPFVEKHPYFPNRTNVEFVEIIAPSVIKVRVWERGAGITLACGTGACASAVALLALNRAQSGTSVRVELPGGALKIEWSRNPLSSVFMEGPAREVFQGFYRAG